MLCICENSQVNVDVLPLICCCGSCAVLSLLSQLSHYSLAGVLSDSGIKCYLNPVFAIWTYLLLVHYYFEVPSLNGWVYAFDKRTVSGNRSVNLVVILCSHVVNFYVSAVYELEGVYEIICNCRFGSIVWHICHYFILEYLVEVVEVICNVVVYILLYFRSLVWFILENHSSVVKLLQNSVDLFYCYLAVFINCELDLRFYTLVAFRCYCLFECVCSRLQHEIECLILLGFPRFNFVSFAVIYNDCSAFDFISAEVCLVDLGLYGINFVLCSVLCFFIIICHLNNILNLVDSFDDNSSGFFGVIIFDVFSVNPDFASCVFSSAYIYRKSFNYNC